MNEKDRAIFIEFLRQKKATITGNSEASLAFLKEIGVVNPKGYINKKYRLSHFTGNLYIKAHKLVASRNFERRKRPNACTPHGRG